MQTISRAAAGNALVAVTLGAAGAGAAAHVLDHPELAEQLWAGATLVALIPALWWVATGLRKGRLGVDLIAVLSLVGTLAVGEYLAGALIAVMLSTGRALEAAAERRATRDLRALLAHVPKTARRRSGTHVTSIPLSEVEVGDTLIVAPGEAVPTNGVLDTPTALLDESALTGEPLTVSRTTGEQVRSGAVNSGPAFELVASATAEESDYATIMRMAREADADSAPVVRLADRYAAWFLPLTLIVAGSAWAVSGSATRAVAVLVVATPCPLLLAAPVAIVSGLARASRLGVVIRSGGALENLAHVRTLVMDKTGTLTSGRPTGTDVVSAPGWEPTEVLRLAASVEQISPHVVAAAVVREARSAGLRLPVPTDVTEEPGRGVTGVVDGHRVASGQMSLPASTPDWIGAVLDRAALDGAGLVWVGVDGQVAGAIVLTDPLRRDAPRTVRRLRAAGLSRLVMLTGDRIEPAQHVGVVLGLDEVRAEQTPVDKAAAVTAERRRAPTVMVGDGVNDAPALAAATVGVALGGRRATATSELADVVLAGDRLARLADAMEVAKKARRIAVQSATVGMGLSLVAMALAAFGEIPPAAGAVLQELIDVAVILNALRALRPPRTVEATLTRETADMLSRFSAEHDELRDALSLIRFAAESIAADHAADQALAALRSADRFLSERLIPHELAEDRELYPALASPLGGPEATATMSRMHAEIIRLGARIHTQLDRTAESGQIAADQSNDLVASLYGLYFLLKLHFSQEEENYFALVEEAHT